jgi:hypothetical protein
MQINILLTRLTVGLLSLSIYCTSYANYDAALKLLESWNVEKAANLLLASLDSDSGKSAALLAEIQQFIKPEEEISYYVLEYRAKAASLGHIDSQVAIARTMLTGSKLPLGHPQQTKFFPIPKNFEQGIESLIRLCGKGIAEPCRILSECYSSGSSCAKDQTVARRYGALWLENIEKAKDSNLQDLCIHPRAEQDTPLQGVADIVQEPAATLRFCLLSQGMDGREPAYWIKRASSHLSLGEAAQIEKQVQQELLSKGLCGPDKGAITARITETVFEMLNPFPDTDLLLTRLAVTALTTDESAPRLQSQDRKRLITGMKEKMRPVLDKYLRATRSTKEYSKWGSKDGLRNQLKDMGFFDRCYFSNFLLSESGKRYMEFRKAFRMATLHGRILAEQYLQFPAVLDVEEQKRLPPVGAIYAKTLGGKYRTREDYLVNNLLRYGAGFKGSLSYPPFLVWSKVSYNSYPAYARVDHPRYVNLLDIIRFSDLDNFARFENSAVAKAINQLQLSLLTALDLPDEQPYQEAIREAVQSLK